MRNKNSAMMIGKVKLKSKSAAFPISSAKEGGASANEVAVMSEMVLRDWSLGMEDESFGRES